MNDNTKRIAKNSIFLYIRLLFTTVIGLYTSRIILERLGITDFGIYNVVGGIVTLLSTFNSTMSIATFRYMSVELGCKRYDNLKSIFSTSLIIHIVLAVIIVVLCESIGVYLVNKVLDIPADRLNAANWAFQFSVATCCLLIISSPYNNCILVHEKMDAYAYLCMGDSVLKLAIVYLIGHTSFDRLIEYAFWFCIAQLLMRLAYGIYCNKMFEETRGSLRYDSDKAKEMLGFTGWNFLTVLANIGFSEGVNILLNIFFGPTVNAARGITEQIRSKVVLLGRNVQDAINPQIMKNYAAGNLEYMHSLIINSSRYSFYMLYLFALPLALEINTVLKLWLKEVPEYTALFSRIIIIFILVNALQNAMITAVNATGKIKWYNIWESATLILVIPIVYIALYIGMDAYWAFILQVLFMIAGLIISVLYVKKLTGFSVLEYFKNVIYSNCKVVIVSFAITYLLHYIMDEGFLRLMIVSVFSIFASGLSILYIGMSNSERINTINIIKKKIFKI